MKAPIDTVLAALDRTRKSGQGWTARCPAHDDRNPSLSVREGDNGAVLIKCMAGCETADVVAAMGLQMSALFPPRDSTSRGNAPDPFRPKRKPTTAVEKPAEPESEGRKIVQFTRADRIVSQPTQWLIDGWLVRDTLAGLVAPSGACKSFLAIDWSCRVATGTPWFGREVRQGAVFYLAGEGVSGLRKRIAAWEKAAGVSIEGAPLYIADSLPFLCDGAVVEAVATAVEAVAEQVFFEAGVEPSLIVIDTLARAMAGANENSSEDMGAFIRAKDLLRTRWGATVLSVHHTGHDKEAQDRGRGSSAYKAALDSEFVIKPGDPEFTVRSTKEKDWPKPPPLCLQRVVIEVEVRMADGSVVRDTSLALHDAAGAVLENNRRARVLELRAQGAKYADIHEATGVPISTAQRWVKEAGQEPHQEVA